MLCVCLNNVRFTTNDFCLHNTGFTTNDFCLHNTGGAYITLVLSIFSFLIFEGILIRLHVNVPEHLHRYVPIFFLLCVL